jgi:hypothetical protein
MSVTGGTQVFFCWADPDQPSPSAMSPLKPDCEAHSGSNLPWWISLTLPLCLTGSSVLDGDISGILYKKK